jgi:hypothetical protein
MGSRTMRSKNERVELEMKIMKYRTLARQIATDPETEKRIMELIADLEKDFARSTSEASRQQADALARIGLAA